MTIPDTMRAAVYRGPGDLQVEDLPTPEIGAGEILVRVAACGICSTDVKKVERGLLPPPLVLGHETAGTVVEVHQTSPAFCLRYEGTELAIDRDVAEDIFVARLD